MILDTTFLLDLMEGLAAATQKLDQFERDNEPLVITTPTLFELFVGIGHSAKPDQERRKITSIVQGQVIWDLDEKSAELGGIAHGVLLKAGKPIGAIDSMIAGVALANKEDILTRNVKHFERFPGIRVQTY